MTALYMPPCMTMPIAPWSGPKNSLILRERMKSTAAGQRFEIFSFSCRKEAGGSTMRPVSRRGDSSASATVIAGRLLSLAMNLPCTWQQRMRTSIMTGVFDTSESSKPSSTALTIDGRLGRGSSSQTWLFMAKAWLRSCMMEEPSP